MGKNMDEGLYDFEMRAKVVYLTTSQTLVLLCTHYPTHQELKSRVVKLKEEGYQIGCNSEVYNEVRDLYNKHDLFIDAMEVYSEDEIMCMLRDEKRRRLWPSENVLLNRIRDRKPKERYLTEMMSHLDMLKLEV